MSFNLTPYEVSASAVHMHGALQKVEEFAPLIALLEVSKPKIIVEIGVGNCGSTWAFSKLPSVETLIAIDLPSGPWGGSDKSLTEQRLHYIQAHSKAKILYIAGNSQNAECLDSVKKALQDVQCKSAIERMGRGELIADKEDEYGVHAAEELWKIDFLFIDGDHSYSGVKTDFLTYSPLVAKPGLIGFHDIAEHPVETGCEVKKFWDEIKASGIPPEDYSEFMQVTEPSWGGIGVIKW